MATEEDLKKAEDEAADEADETEAPESPKEEGDEAEVRGKRDKADRAIDEEAEAEASEGTEEVGEDVAPMQLGYQRFVYAAYMAGALLVAFLTAKIGHVGWYRLGQWKPELGEPKDELLYPAALVVGIAVSVYYWRKQSARQYANEVAEELSKVTWPSRKEVTNSTTVVVLTTLFATVFFALMDRFWGYITDKIYSF
jgi:preprotein translocase subunit SecE